MARMGHSELALSFPLPLLTETIRHNSGRMLPENSCRRPTPHPRTGFTYRCGELGRLSRLPALLADR
jgi:hypothetical protein